MMRNELVVLWYYKVFGTIFGENFSQGEKSHRDKEVGQPVGGR
jgi:hypothetical protein